MTSAPYLSIVAAARNDNHGGNMLRRMQIFINGVITQARRYQVPIELIIVEWNPPTDNLRLSEALSWEIGDSPCVVRVIEVPNELHHQLRHSASLPLFQMIAKNVGIRRATGEFVLATNIDLLFSDALFEFLASRQLQPGKSYRVDRYDVASEVPLESSIEEQFVYCDRSIIRINHKDGIEEKLVEIPEIEQVPQDAISVPLNQKWYEKMPESTTLKLAKVRQIYKQLLPTSVRDTILNFLPKDFQLWLVERELLTAQPLPIPPEPAADIITLPPTQPLPYAKLHTNTSGDFTLLSKADWFAIRGYAEWEMYSFHLDSILLYTAHYAGIEEEILNNDMRAYHIEHSSGWTPEAERSQVLDNRLSSLGIPKLTMEQLDAIARLMEQLGKPILFNDENWGLNQHTLSETVIAPTMVQH
ncbi:hypothetical protein JOY44_04265 [Phormidium sp. CLA17]|uniref:hypothetical protein n=1 Tax=Leptolyngbya sp. Cla-17 TaxID=2803751 RepID=UPI0014930E1A|nr:hypothetical protein [Leptolyngbya sp. Cla-17]MBM0740837.1 hypothetical protein [Leptolyngbya sp. Cla-17]